MRIKMANGFYLEKDGPGYYYYNKTICNRIDKETKLVGPAAEMVKEAMEELDKRENANFKVICSAAIPWAV